jgi:hypothetical protein
MATLAEETKRRGKAEEIWKSRSAYLENQLCKFWKIGHASFHKNLRIIITVRLMVKMKNFFWLKNGLGPCLEDANIK